MKVRLLVVVCLLSAAALLPATADGHWLSGSRARQAITKKYATFDNVFNLNIVTCVRFTAHHMRCVSRYTLTDQGQEFRCSEIAKVRLSPYSYKVRVFLYNQEC